MKHYWVPEEALFDSAEECLTGLGGLGSATLVCSHEGIDALNDLTDCRAELKLSAKINSRLVEQNKILLDAVMYYAKPQRSFTGAFISNGGIAKMALEAIGHPLETASKDEK